MIHRTFIIGAIAATGLGASVTMAPAQEESTNRVGAETDWSVFVEDDPTQCWVVSLPTETVNTRDGVEVEVDRGDTLMFVSFWPSQNRMGEVSYTGGYPYREGVAVTVEIGSTTFELITEDNMAWAASPEDDARMIAAMKQGAEAVVTGISSRGTTTTDTVSLFGFTAAVEDAEARCGG